MPYKAAVFDLDGTLLDTLADIADAANRVLAKRGFPVHEVDKYHYFVGNGARILMTRVLPEKERRPDLIQECYEAFRMEYGAGWNRKTKPFPGIDTLLDRLSAKNIKLNVLSNKPHEFTQKCINAFLSDWNFRIVLGQRESIPLKPDPAGAFEIVKQLNLEPADFLYIGDTAIDMQTAVAAGMFPVGVLWGFHTAKELKEGGAKALIKYPTDLLDLL